ncbi:MAG: leucyl aminopeptidase [Sporomusaceae bacterium]|nr:leucyl aminopeptidase [Sporomusaceae bacterium]
MIALSDAKLVESSSEALVVWIPDTGSLPPDSSAGEIDRALDGNLTVLCQDQPHSCRLGEMNVVYTNGAVAAKWLIVAGIGRPEQLTPDNIRFLAGAVARKARQLAVKSLALPLTDLFMQRFDTAGFQVCAEGVRLGLYQFDHYKTDKLQRPLPAVTIIAGRVTDAVVAAAAKGEIIADSIALARDMVNHPSSYMTPARMAALATEMAAELPLELNVLHSTQIREQGLEALWSVGKGSDEAPVLLVLRYCGAPEATGTLGIIGKGITFDSGGISIKPSEGMGEMKDDMGGAAAVLAAMQAIARLKPAANVLAVIPCAENMPSGHALKPGDVIGSHAGKTIEIITTDAEGRLVLADAISYARSLGATKLVDLATLTGACVVALGKVASATIANDEQWSETVLAAAETAGEKMWPLPAYDEYKEQIKSDIADLKNSGGRPAGAITAGLFLAAFAGDTPWVHIDIAGTVTSEKERGYQAKGATGVGVRTLIELAAAQ